MCPRRTNWIISRFVLQFFENYLRQAEHAPLLSVEESYMNTGIPREIMKTISDAAQHGYPFVDIDDRGSPAAMAMDIEVSAWIGGAAGP